MTVTVEWEGATPPGTPPNELTIKIHPLLAAQLVLLLETPVIVEQVAQFPRAYAGVQELHDKVSALLDLAEQGRIQDERRYAQAVMSGEIDAGKPLPRRRRVETVQLPPGEAEAAQASLYTRDTGPRPFAAGRARVPGNSYGFGGFEPREGVGIHLGLTAHGVND